MKIELSSNELRIVMNALDRSHKRASNDIRNARDNKVLITISHDTWKDSEFDYEHPPYEDVIDGLIAKRSDIVALKAKIRSLQKGS